MLVIRYIISKHGRHYSDKGMRGYDCANNSILCMAWYFALVYLFSFKLVVIILGIGTALTLTTTVVNNTLYH